MAEVNQAALVAVICGELARQGVATVGLCQVVAVIEAADRVVEACGVDGRCAELPAGGREQGGGG